MKKFFLLCVFTLWTLQTHSLEHELNALAQSLQTLANALQPAPAQGPDIDYALTELARLKEKQNWESGDTQEYQGLLNIVKLGKIAQDVLEELETVLQEKTTEKIAPPRPAPSRPKSTPLAKPKPRPGKPLSKPLTKPKPKTIPPKPKPVYADEPVDKVPSIEEPEEDEMALALQGLEEIAKKESWGKADAAQFNSLLEIIKAGGAEPEIVGKYTAIYEQKEAAAVDAPSKKPVKKPEPPKKAPVKPTIVVGEVIEGERVLMKPSFVQFVQKTFMQDGKPIPSAMFGYELYSTIGIDSKGTLVVFGPQLKKKPTAATFLTKDGTFKYPSIEDIKEKSRIDDGKTVVADFYVYKLLTKDQVDELGESTELLKMNVYNFYTTLQDTGEEPEPQSGKFAGES